MGVLRFTTIVNQLISKVWLPSKCRRLLVCGKVKPHPGVPSGSDV
jgi:hypothetical protein